MVAAPPRAGPVGAVLAGIRLPVDLLVAAGSAVRAVPYLVQDVRSIVNDTARVMHDNDPQVIGEVLDSLGRVAGPDGALTHALDAGAELAEARADRERADIAETSPSRSRSRSG